jgi:5'-methylthioadenosine phosphorylase
MSEVVKVAVIGGSGLYQMEELTDRTAVSVDTPYGQPSADIIIGTLRGQRVAFLPRHGEGHVYSPSTVPYRANIYALKSLGVRFIIAVNACGSLKEEYAPGHIVIPDQVYDQTKSDRGGRSFFESGLVGHISVADPFCPELAKLLHTSVQQAGGTVHQGGTFIIVEGPRFSTKGESHIYRQWGCSIIGMTTTPEVFLAREAEIAYASMAHITDYDVWHVSEEPVTVDMVIRIMNRNLETAQKAIALAVENLDADATYDAHNALGSALMTARDKIPAALLEQLDPIIGRYFGSSV